MLKSADSLHLNCALLLSGFNENFNVSRSLVKLLDIVLTKMDSVFLEYLHVNRQIWRSEYMNFLRTSRCERKRNSQLESNLEFLRISKKLFNKLRILVGYYFCMLHV